MSVPSPQPTGPETPPSQGHKLGVLCHQAPCRSPKASPGQASALLSFSPSPRRANFPWTQIDCRDWRRGGGPDHGMSGLRAVTVPAGRAGCMRDVSLLPPCLGHSSLHSPVTSDLSAESTLRDLRSKWPRHPVSPHTPSYLPLNWQCWWLEFEAAGRDGVHSRKPSLFSIYGISPCRGCPNPNSGPIFSV